MASLPAVPCPAPILPGTLRAESREVLRRAAGGAHLQHASSLRGTLSSTLSSPTFDSLEQSPESIQNLSHPGLLSDRSRVLLKRSRFLPDRSRVVTDRSRLLPSGAQGTAPSTAFSLPDWARGRRCPQPVCQAGSLGNPRTSPVRSPSPRPSSPLRRELLLPCNDCPLSAFQRQRQGHGDPVPHQPRHGGSLSLSLEPGHGGKVGRVFNPGNYAVASFAPLSRCAGPARLKPCLLKPRPKSVGEVLCSTMPHIVVVAAATALVHPPCFTWFQKQHYPYALGGIMLSIGAQLSVADFKTVLQQPLPVALGCLLQFAIKPALALLAIPLFHVPPQFAAGLTLTACVSGAQLASYATSLAKGSVALSVVLTSLSTLASIVATPLLSKLLIGSAIPVDPLAMAKSIMQVVVLPITLGLLLNAYAKPVVERVRPFLPVLATTCTVLCIGSPLAFNRATLLSWHGLALVAPIAFFHLASAAAGYWMTRMPWLRQSEGVARTLSINGAMQSSTLAALLATQFLGGSHPVPPSISVVFMAVLGLSLGSFWGKGLRLRDAAADFVEGLSLPAPLAVC